MKTTNFKYETHPAIDEWMRMVEQGEVLACKEQHELMEFVRNRIYDDDIVIKADLIEKAITRAERYFFVLHPFQRFFYAFVVGVYTKDDFLLFDEYFFLAGRGTGKNGLISTLMFNLPDINGIDEYNIDLVATSERQAKTSFKDVYKVIKKNSKKLKKFWKITLELITHKKSTAEIAYHTSNAKTKDGLRPGAILFDEIHEFLNDELIRVFSSALGKVKYGRTFYLTTDGYVRGGYLDSLKALVKEIFSDKQYDLKFFPFIFKLDSIEEVHDEKNWVKAIPRLMYDEVLFETLRKEYKKALRDSGAMVEFLTKRMNIPTEDAFSVVAKWEDIEATQQEMPDLKRKSCVGAIDYADIRDFAAVGLLFNENGKRYWIHHTFICKKTLALTNFKFDIDRAVREGYATILDDDFIRPEYLADWFVEKRKEYNITEISADRWRFTALDEAFTKEGIKLKEVPSGPITHGKISTKVDIMFSEHSIVFGDDFMMRWYTNNVKVIFDSKGNKTYEKIEPKTRKTDGFMALIHALVIEPKEEEKTIPRYNRRLRTVTN